MMQDKRRESPERPDLQLVAMAKQTLGSFADIVYGIVTSKWLHMAILRIFLTLSFTTFAYYLAIPAYAYFYHVHLPDQIITAPLHLQYGIIHSYEDNLKNRSPYAITSFTHKTIKTLQPYDVDITLTLPPSPANLAYGNFMVGLILLGDPDPISNNTTAPRFPESSHFIVSPLDPYAYLAARPTLHTSLRPTRLPYRSRLTSLTSSMLRLPYYALYPDAELTTLTVVMAERLTFPRGSPVPRAAVVEIQTCGGCGCEGKAPPEVYAAQVTLRSQLGGLRWLMYHYRITSFVVFTAMFLVTAVWCFLVTFTVGGLVVKGLMP
ncbi:putative adipose-regulatory protein-domain-containing protein, partial [Podospora conica]